MPTRQRYGRVVKIKPEKLESYKKLHAAPWKSVLNAIKQCNIRNFSIFYRDGYLFSYFEYIGDNYHDDMKNLASLTHAWLNETDQCQMPLSTASPGELWVEMIELFHCS